MYLNEDDGMPVDLVMLRDNGTCITPHIVICIPEIIRLEEEKSLSADHAGRSLAGFLSLIDNV